MYSILIIYLLATSTIAQKTQCEQYVQKLINDIFDFKIASLPLPSIMYSGIAPNSPGQIKECKDFNYSYYLVFIKNTTTMTESFRGLCMPNQCVALDIQIALQFLHCRVYDENELKIIDNIAIVGGGIIVVWLLLLFSCSCFISLKQPIINEYLVGQKSQSNTDSASVSADQSTQAYSEPKYENNNYFNYYQGYRRMFKFSNKNSVLSLVLFLAVASFAVSVEFSYRQNIAQNTNEIFQTLNSVWGIFICNTQINLHTIIFILGFKLASSLHKMKNFRNIGRLFFDAILKKWIILILMSLLVYSVSSFIIDQPLSKIWRDCNGKDCPKYIWQTWFVFRNLQLDGKICLPWFTLLEADLLFTILTAPFIVIFRVSKKLGYFLILVLMFTSVLISYAILKNQAVIYEPAKLMNSQKQFYIDYQGNAFVRMGAFYLGVFFGLFITEGYERDRNLSIEPVIYKKISKIKIIQWILPLIGFGLMVLCFLRIQPYLDIQSQSKQPFYYLIFNPLLFVFGLGLFIIPSSWEGEAEITKLINKFLAWQGWIHLDRISITFYMLAPLVIGYSTYSSQNSIYYDVQTVLAYLLGDLLTIYFISILVTASFQNQLIPIISWIQLKILGQQAQFSAILIEEL